MSGSLTDLAVRALFVPLTGDAAAPFVVVTLDDGRRALPIFTSRELLERAAATHALRDRLGELRPGEAPGRLALGHVARAGLDAAVIDLGGPVSFVATRAEIEAALASMPRRDPSGAFTTQKRPAAPAAIDRFRALVVDDDATILAMVRRFLESRGVQVESSSSPFGVTQLVSRHKPSVLVLDVSMPALDGEQVAALVRAMPDAPAIVFYSAAGRSSMDALTDRVGDVERVPKDAGLDALWAAILRARRKRP